MHGRQGSRQLAAVLVMGVCLLGAGCEVDSPPIEPRARVRVIHASPDTPAVDIYAWGQPEPLFTDVAYGEATDFQSLLEGFQIFNIRGAGEPADAAPLYTAPALELPPGEVTVVAAGLLREPATERAFRLLPLPHAFAEDAVPRLRFVHAVADAPALSLDLEGDGLAEVFNLGRFEATAAGGLPLATGRDIPVSVLAGAPPAVVATFTLPPQEPGARLFLVATGRFEPLAPQPRELVFLLVDAAGQVRRLP